MRDFTYPATLAIGKTLFRALGIRFQMSGLEHLPTTGGAVLASNHVGYVDWLFNGAAAEKRGRVVRFMAKQEAFTGLTGRLMRSYHHIPVDREKGEASLRTAIDYARAGEIVGIFPEATISRAMEPKEFKTGAVRIAAEAGVPLIPMAVWGTQLMKTKDHESDLWSRGKTIALLVGEPIAVTGDDVVAETARLQEAITALVEKAVADYPLGPDGQWWAPARLGGLAPTLEEAARIDAAEKAARAAKRAARDNS